MLASTEATQISRISAEIGALVQLALASVSRCSLAILALLEHGDARRLIQ